MNHIIELETDASTLSKIVAYIRSLKIKFSVKETEESPYDPEFVKMVLESRKGKTVPYTDELKKDLFGV